MREEVGTLDDLRREAEDVVDEDQSVGGLGAGFIWEEWVRLSVRGDGEMGRSYMS